MNISKIPALELVRVEGKRNLDRFPNPYFSKYAVIQ